MSDKHKLFQTWGDVVAAGEARRAAGRKGAATRRANDPRNAPCTSTYTDKRTGKEYACQRHMQGYHVSDEGGGHREWAIA